MVVGHTLHRVTSRGRPNSIGDDFELAHLIDDRYKAVVARDLPLARKRGLRLADMGEEPWISSTLRCGCRAITDRACRDAGFEPRVAFEADERMAAQAFVAAGVGVTILPRLALSPLRTSVVARSLGREAPVRRIWAARPAEGYRSPASEAMVQVLRDVAEEFRAEPELVEAG